MRAALLALAALGAAAVVDVAPAQAQYGPIYPWCAQYGGRDGATNCYFANLWQCRQAISGNGGYCYRNPFMAYAAGPSDDEQMAPRRTRRSR